MTRHSPIAEFDCHMAYYVYAAMISKQYFHRTQAHPFYLLSYVMCSFLTSGPLILLQFLRQNLYLIFKGVSFGRYTGLPVSKQVRSTMCCATIHNHAARTSTQCCMTQHRDAERRANSAPNPPRSIVLGTHRHLQMPDCNLVNTLRAVPGDSSR